MAGLDIRAVLADHEGQDYDLYAQTINPQFIKMLRTIGYDRVWGRARGRLPLRLGRGALPRHDGGFGMFNVGRNNPRIRAALVDVARARDARLACSSASAASPVCSPRAARRMPEQARARAVHELGHRGRRGRAQARARRDRTRRACSRPSTASTG